MKKNISPIVIKNFFRIGLPSILWIFALCTLLFGGFSTTNNELIEWLFTLIGADIFSDNPEIGVIILRLLLYLAISPILIPLLGIFLTVIPIFIVSAIFWGDLENFSVDSYMLWLLAVAWIWSYISAFKFKFGKMLEDSSRKTGEHYEVEYDASSDTTTVKKVDEISGGFEWIINIILFFLRIPIIAFLGIIIFIIQTISFYRRKSISK